jgi:hypothetical protein
MLNYNRIQFFYELLHVLCVGFEIVVVWVHDPDGCNSRTGPSMKTWFLEVVIKVSSSVKVTFDEGS